MELLRYLHVQARANRLANRRLHAAMAPLSRDEFHAPRTSFFPSLAASDERLVAWCDAVDAAGLDAVIEMERATHVQRERAAHVLAHLFNHQTHHRGQAHAMPAGTTIAPQLDEFMMPSEAHLRAADMAALGWRESDVYG